jgi:hypothetical protein
MIKSDIILFMYNSEFTEIFKNFDFKHNIKINHIKSNIYSVEYPENDIELMYKCLYNDKEISLNEMREKLNLIFANPIENDWWEIYGLKGNIILS